MRRMRERGSGTARSKSCAVLFCKMPWLAGQKLGGQLGGDQEIRSQVRGNGMHPACTIPSPRPTCADP